MKWTRIDADTTRRAFYTFKASPAGHHVRHARHDDETVPAGIHMSQLVAILRRRSKLILAGAMCGTLLATAIGLLIPPKYTALAQIVVAASQGGSSGGAPTSNSSDESEIDTQVKMLT